MKKNSNTIIEAEKAFAAEVDRDRAAINRKAQVVLASVPDPGIRRGALAKTKPRIPSDHPLVGTWITDAEDSDAAFTVSVKNNKFCVSGICRSDGEAFKITHARWDGKALSFTARMPSTDTRTENVFRLRRDGGADLELTTYEVWKKKEVKRGELPEAWR